MVDANGLEDQEQPKKRRRNRKKRKTSRKVDPLDDENNAVNSSDDEEQPTEKTIKLDEDAFTSEPIVEEEEVDEEFERELILFKQRLNSIPRQELLF